MRCKRCKSFREFRDVETATGRVRQVQVWVRQVQVGVRQVQVRDSSYLTEGDVLLGPELVVPDLRLLPESPQPPLQGRLLGGDMVRDWPDV